MSNVETFIQSYYADLEMSTLGVIMIMASVVVATRVLETWPLYSAHDWSISITTIDQIYNRLIADPNILPSSMILGGSLLAVGVSMANWVWVPSQMSLLPYM